MKKLVALTLITTLLPACAALPPAGRPAPETPAAGHEPAPSPTPPAPRSDNSAVVALLETARRDTATGRLDAAAATLERALRIEPRNPALWHQLARVRLRQEQAGQAIQLATKSNALAGDNHSLRADNWRVIGEARTSQGDHTGAEAAFAKAEEFGRR